MIDLGQSAPAIEPGQLEKATGDRIYYFGVPPFPGEGEGTAGLRALPPDARKKIDLGVRIVGEHAVVRVHTAERPRADRRRRAAHHGEHQRSASSSSPRRRPRLRDTWVTLMKFFGVSILGGLLVAGVLAWYASAPHHQAGARALRSRGPDRAGQLQRPRAAGFGRDEISHLADRFGRWRAAAETEERERNFLMTVSHELRTPLTAIRGHVEAMREG